MAKRVVTIVIVVALLLGLGLTAHLTRGFGVSGLAEVFREMHGR